MATAELIAATNNPKPSGSAECEMPVTKDRLLDILPRGASRSMAAPHVARLIESAEKLGLQLTGGSAEWDRADDGRLTLLLVAAVGVDADGVVRGGLVDLATVRGVCAEIEVPLSCASGCGAEPRSSGADAAPVGEGWGAAPLAGASGSSEAKASEVLA